MTCIEKIYSVSALVGTGKCNANCAFCAGKCLRKTVSPSIKLNYLKNLESAIKLCAKYGGWSLSLTGSGEPTCEPEAVTEALEVYNKCANQGAYFPNVNLFSNGILLGDKEYCDKWLPIWRRLGLTNIAISVHSVLNEYQADAYGIKEYPDYKDIINNIRTNGVGVRCTLLLNKKIKEGCGTCNEYVNDVGILTEKFGIDSITSWPVGNPDGSRNEFTPDRWELFKIKRWLNKNTIPCHEHSWGGGVFDKSGNMLRFTDYVTKHDPKKDYVRQLVVFHDGTVTYSWIKEGALCMK